MSALLVDMVFVVEMLIFKDLLKGWCWDVCFLSGYSDRGDVCVCESQCQLVSCKS